jgi:hypothetical protein
VPLSRHLGTLTSWNPLGHSRPVTGVNSASNRNEYQVYPGGKGGQCVRLTTYHHTVPLSRHLGTLTSWNPLGHSRPVTGLLYLLIVTRCTVQLWKLYRLLMTTLVYHFWVIWVGFLILWRTWLLSSSRQSYEPPNFHEQEKRKSWIFRVPPHLRVSPQTVIWLAMGKKPCLSHQQAILWWTACVEERLVTILTILGHNRALWLLGI